MKRLVLILFGCLLALTLCACAKQLVIPEIEGVPDNEIDLYTQELSVYEDPIEEDREDEEEVEETSENELTTNEYDGEIQEMRPGDYYTVKTAYASIKITCISEGEKNNYDRWDNSSEEFTQQYNYEIITGDDCDEYLLSNGNTILDMHIIDDEYEREGYNEEGYNTDGDTNIYLLTKEGEKTLLLKGYPLAVEEVQNPRIYKMLNNSSFIYAIGGWEWTWYSGLYDLQSFEDHPFHGTASPFLLEGNTLFTIDAYGELYGLTKTSLITFETENMLSDIIADSSPYSFDISPEGKFFVLLSQDSWNFDTQEYDDCNIKICSLENNNLICSIPLPSIDNAYFYSETQIIAYRESYSENATGYYLLEII